MQQHKMLAHWQHRDVAACTRPASIGRNQLHQSCRLPRTHNLRMQQHADMIHETKRHTTSRYRASDAVEVPIKVQMFLHGCMGRPRVYKGCPQHSTAAKWVGGSPSPVLHPSMELVHPSTDLVPTVLARTLLACGSLQWMWQCCSGQARRGHSCAHRAPHRRRR